MRLSINIPCGDCDCYYRLLPAGDYQRIDVEGVVIFDIHKVHDHRYDLKAFFYANKVIVSTCSYSTKSKLYGAIQKLLQEYL